MGNSPTIDGLDGTLASGRPKRRTANVHPGQIVLDSQPKRRTSAQKQADDNCAQEALAAKVTAMQKGYQRVSNIEERMQMDQTTDSAIGARPVRPRPRPRIRTASVTGSMLQEADGMDTGVYLSLTKNPLD